MKSSDKPVISKKWWTKEKPADIKGADLEKALGVCEKALDDAKKKKDAESIDAALEALDDLDEAVDSTVKECEKKKLKDVVTVLEKFEKLIDGERADLEKLKGALEQESGEEESDDDAKGVLKEEYRARMIKMLRAGEQLQFCLGLNKQTPAESFLLLCNKRKPERLQKILKQTGDFSTRLLTFGTVKADGKILDLSLADNSKEPAQIAKTSKEYFKSHRDLKFRKVRVHSAGQTFEEEDPEEQAASGVAGSAGAGKNGSPQNGAAAGNEQNGNARQQAQGDADQTNKRKLFAQAKAKWMAARDKAERDLEVVKDGVRDHYLNDVDQFPIAVAKLKELDEIFDNLNHDLRDALDEYVHTPLNKKDLLEQHAASARQIVDTFADYVEASDLLTAIDQKEFADVQIKAPLSAALRELEKTLA
jgi:hypothetical protein